MPRGIAISKLPSGGDILVGRESELAQLDEALTSESTHVISFVAWGGTGKSALADHWMNAVSADNWRGIDRYFDWSFYSQGTRGEQGTSADLFIAEALKFFGDPDPQAGSPHDRGERLAKFAAEHRTLLILDGLEPMQFGPGTQEGLIKDPALRSLLRSIAQKPFNGLCVLTTRPDCLAALREKPILPGLNEPLVDLDNEEWNSVLSDLEKLDLAKREDSDKPPAKIVDAHPLIREYFAKRLKSDQTQPEDKDISGGRGSRRAASATPDPAARQEPRPPGQKDVVSSSWTEGHIRLFEHLCNTTEHRPATIDGLAPLYQAVAHGCQAGLHEKARVDVYHDRILRGTGSDDYYSSRKLGAISADLGAVACFFDRPWSQLSPSLSPAAQAWLLNEAACYLRALGRLTEAAEPMQVALGMAVEQKTWKNAAIVAGNLSELELTLGEVSAAVATGEQSVTFADRSGNEFQRMGNRTTHADALHQASRGSGFQPEQTPPEKWQGLPAPAESAQHGLEACPS